jgi:Na+/H+ antiporter NhaD/arsenite permease-like protein
MRGVSSAARLADYPPRSGRLVLLAMLVAFVLVGLFQRHHDNAAVAAVAAVVATVLLVLVLRPEREPAVEDGGRDREVAELARG